MSFSSLYGVIILTVSVAVVHLSTLYA